MFYDDSSNGFEPEIYKQNCFAQVLENLTMTVIQTYAFAFLGKIEVKKSEAYLRTVQYVCK